MKGCLLLSPPGEQAFLQAPLQEQDVLDLMEVLQRVSRPVQEVHALAGRGRVLIVVKISFPEHKPG